MKLKPVKKYNQNSQNFTSIPVDVKMLEIVKLQSCGT